MTLATIIIQALTVVILMSSAYLGWKTDVCNKATAWYLANPSGSDNEKPKAVRTFERRWSS